jgi:hypothetical protein
MKTKPDVEDLINKAFNSVRNTEPFELPYGFEDRVLNRLHAKKDNVRSIYSISPLLKVAAMVVLIVVNALTLKLAFSPQPNQNPPQYATIKDFVNDYQINDANDELATINTPAHEQP